MSANVELFRFSFNPELIKGYLLHGDPETKIDGYLKRTGVFAVVSKEIAGMTVTGFNLKQCAIYSLNQDGVKGLPSTVLEDADKLSRALERCAKYFAVFFS